MSGYEQGGEAPSAGAAAASAPTAKEEQQSKQRALEEKIRELKDLKATINTLESKIANDEAKAVAINDGDERLEFRRAIAEDKKRLNLLEAERAELRHEIKQLSAPAEQPTAAGGCSPTSCLPLRPRICLSRRVLRALLLLRELTAPSTCAHALPRAPHVALRGLCVRHLCVCITRLCASMVLRYRCPIECVPPPTSSTPHLGQPTAARERSPTLCQPLRSLIGLVASQGIAGAPLATGI